MAGKHGKKWVDPPPWSNHMGVSKNRGTPKRMVYNGKLYQNGWFGGTTIFGNIHINFLLPLQGNPGEPWGHRFRERSFDCVVFNFPLAVKNSAKTLEHAKIMQVMYQDCLPSLELTSKSPENGWLEDLFLLGWPIFRRKLLVSGVPSM